jgi:hypothetical protein
MNTLTRGFPRREKARLEAAWSNGPVSRKLRSRNLVSEDLASESPALIDHPIFGGIIQ